MTYQITALGLTGTAWIKRLEKNGYKLSTYAEQLLNSPEWEKHRMKKGEKVSVSLVLHKDVGTYPTTQKIQDYAGTKGYQKPKGELVLLIREVISDEEIEKLGLGYIAALHDPIKDSDGFPHVLCARRGRGGRWVDAYWDSPRRRWSAGGASAFLVPASTSTSDTQPPSDTLSLELRIEKLEAFYKKVVELIPSLEV